jgi:hypothetical protein
MESSLSFNHLNDSLAHTGSDKNKVKDTRNSKRFFSEEKHKACDADLLREGKGDIT